MLMYVKNFSSKLAAMSSFYYFFPRLRLQRIILWDFVGVLIKEILVFFVRFGRRPSFAKAISSNIEQASANRFVEGGQLFVIFLGIFILHRQVVSRRGRRWRDT